MKDCLGNILQVNDWVLKGGKGNTTAEYGMILHQIREIKEIEGIILTNRISVDYVLSNKENILLKIRKTNIQNSMTCVKIVPPQKIINLFKKIENDNYTDNEAKLISKWIHGTKQIW